MISSVGNPHVKQLRSLATDRRERRRERSFVLEGVRLVATALDAGAEITLALFAPDQLAALPAGQALLARLERLPYCYEAAPQVVASAADTVTPQGVVAAARWPVVKAGPPGLVLVIDAVQDPGNVGTLLRSAEAVGVAEVICTRGTADVYSPKVVRAAMGAHFGLALRADVDAADLGAALGALPNVYAAASEATMPYYAADWRQPAALIVGNEANGIGEAALAVATKQISIPMLGRAESLNAAVAGSVVMFEALRQRARGRS
ncbi:MAG: RNA methyltransferase [Chloroflexales bacterium]|nr:RNA methyltransferase [Chloroflexales bacterium]